MSRIGALSEVCVKHSLGQRFRVASWIRGEVRLHIRRLRDLNVRRGGGGFELLAAAAKGT